MGRRRAVLSFKYSMEVEEENIGWKKKYPS